MIIVSPDLSVIDRGGLRDEHLYQIRDISIYGQIDVANPSTDQYRTVELIAYSLFDQFHRKRTAIAAKDLPKGWSVIQNLGVGSQTSPNR
jgi:hypothetical protein